MGDHGARIYGSQMFPLRSYRVPVLLISPDDAGRGQRCPTLACSLDVAPTILGRLGGEYRSVFFGRDVLTTAVDEGRAVMQHNHDVAVLTPDHHLVTLGFGKASWQYLVDPDTLELQQTHAPADGHVRDAAALFQLTHDLYYSDRWYPDADVRQSPLGAADGEAPIAAVSGDSANLEQRERP